MSGWSLNPMGLALLLSGAVGLWRLWTADALTESAMLHLLRAEIGAAWPVDGYAWLLSWWPFPWREAAGLAWQWLMSTALAGIFVAVVGQLTRDRPVHWVAAVVIALHPALNDLRGQLGGDFTYWVCLLMALWVFPHTRDRWQWNALWQLLLFAAVLLQRETVVLWLLWPLFWWGDWVNQPRIPWVGHYFGLLLWLLWPDSGAVLMTAWGALMAGHEQLVAQSAQFALLLDMRVANYAYSAMWLLFGLLVADKLVATLSPLYCVLPWFRAFRTRLRLSRGHRRLWRWLIAVHSGVLVGFWIAQGHVSESQLMPLTLLLLTLTPFLLVAVHDHWQQQRRWHPAFGVMGLLLAFMVVDGLFSLERPQQYLRQAGQWLAQHVPASETVYLNEARLAYYSGRLDGAAVAGWQTTPAWHAEEAVLSSVTADWLALWVSHRRPALAKALRDRQGEPMAVFANSRGDQVLIFRRDPAQPEANRGFTPEISAVTPQNAQ